jgi:glycosyltransferase involved in cell wall biosynthesis
MYSRLFVEQEAAEWVLSYEARQLVRTAEALGIRIGPAEWARGVANQSIFHLSQFTLLQHDFQRNGNRLGLSYFHGRPGTPGMPEFDACFDTLRARHQEIDRVQVTNRAMAQLVLSTGIDAEKVHTIPIGIDTDVFRPGDEDAHRAARERLGLPGSAFVVGSFQKDGVGWGEGLEPKLIKGPDVLLAVAEQLSRTLPELHFLLTGPARGYVRVGLERLGIPYRHMLLPDVDAVADMYPAIDVCLVASRDEGGPRAVHESMATRVPLVTTRVGQAADLVRDGENGSMVEPEDVDGLVDAILRVAAAGKGDLDAALDAGRRVAEENSYLALRPRWRALLDGFVALPAS